MFLVDAAILLPHPPYVVARVVERLHLMPRWCRELRRVRVTAPVVRSTRADARAEATCVFAYTITDVRLVLQARTIARVGDPAADASARDAYSVTHTAEGDGLTLTWTLTAAPCEGPPYPHATPNACTELRARVEVHVDAAHSLHATRAPLCRAVARRVPADLDRLRTLLARYEASRIERP